MESNTWNVNPTDILNNDNHYKTGQLEDNAKFSNHDLEQEETYRNYLDLTYENMDNVLSQKLNDLDIPLVPTNAQNDITLNFDDDFNWNQLKIDESTSTTVAPTYNNNTRQHKRGMSGTAIFGFANHTKELSISNNNFEYPIDSGNHYEPHQQNSNDSMVIGQQLLKQQEQLKMALDKQKEMNIQLEQQLLENRKQQEQLQNALAQQQMVTNNLVINSPSKSPSHTAHTPRSTRVSNDNAIIITSNSKSGKFEFPAPQNPTTMMISPPLSNTPFNGSPTNNRRNRSFMHGFQSNTESDLLNINSNQNYDYSKELNTPNLTNGSTMNNSRQSNTLHYKKESNYSTTSTIPQYTDEDTSDSEYMKSMGLGIQVDSRAIQNNLKFKGSQKLDMLPTIAGSNQNTPVKVQPPQKYKFQHTPIKQQQYSNTQFTENKDNINDNFKNDMKPTNIFSQRNRTPQLALSSHIKSVDDSARSDIYGTSPSNGSNLQFKTFETPSPSHKQDDNKGFTGYDGNMSRSVVNLDNTPVKITTKPTTLPRGSIDIYVKELPDKTFVCLYQGCQKSFKRRYNVRSHIQTHLEDRPYTCDYEGCEKSFVRNHDLIRHRKRHDERNIVCPCGQKFANQKSMENHKNNNICIGGTNLQKSVTKTSPKKYQGNRPGNNNIIINSPVKEAVTSEVTADYVIKKMEQQLKQEMANNGFLEPPPIVGSETTKIGSNTTTKTLISPSPSTGLSDLGSPFLGFSDIAKTIT
ncbi:hypothetical protein TPHA_0A01540 [Tetrapisispora phaffii CBS 4417]|uniref:C2H2-type domain-containing protein n=1 Tax=Tetrapisispora phaffii (strain ATCC 24235 / CBS 4417 / NBRC 1672 / NRRL Y-8282 / UCD 70-5) TaxID=1071381 RepID=G8BMV9_TETPH|nr:hypothetical protein TPHA_0A01540 [Tetrapisispora phaffii CBS 4417]CCE61237.1 hypothetical protein TPHA_0A01540 [Tetrapisispora phaffii CBS 4417]